MIVVKRLKDCTIEEGVKAWNTGFEGYYFDATTSPDRFINRLAAEGLSSELSIVAFKNNEPIGIVKNGIREVNGKKIAWNGGTGVASKVRKQGIGQILMEETLNVYREAGVDIATLEAISDNERAIALYKKMGYEIVDNLVHLELKGSVIMEEGNTNQDYFIESAIPQQTSTLPFYKGMNPWQTHWQAAKEGQAIIVKDMEGIEIGYAYFKRSLDPQGTHVGTILFQCEADPSRDDADKIIDFMLNYIFNYFREDIRRVIPNLPKKKSYLTYMALERLGFKEIANQVFMLKNCN
ncbi:GNAT family N-acetyltransferase [Bacillus sp. S/N-304-OC-R1]|uniref:GNAT family N-acetyltransferase n=1 Tax=Bacillus sp. S/N-304-OC-R1 TaxID=2758034 RepID=UPI001C8CF512|nr:GNAT family N-acetyltransferase [Bacillus sp. S/N-304-OC-R1]MBY0122805.1 GNAT family N-acetyltransferase [Bacillus sp. S/N-304-OC-R1]